MSGEGADGTNRGDRRGSARWERDPPSLGAARGSGHTPAKGRTGPAGGTETGAPGGPGALTGVHDHVAPGGPHAGDPLGARLQPPRARARARLPGRLLGAEPEGEPNAGGRRHARGGTGRGGTGSDGGRAGGRTDGERPGRGPRVALVLPVGRAPPRRSRAGPALPAKADGGKGSGKPHPPPRPGAPGGRRQCCASSACSQSPPGLP